MRKGTWYWRIWWWIGYHGIYQIGWWWKNKQLSPTPDKSLEEKV